MYPRSWVYDKHEVGVYHCFSRVVRRAFLMGTDSYTKKNYDHRKQWVEDLFELVAECFKVDIVSFAVMDNHLHCILRNRPDLKKKLPPTAVARRWLLLHPKRRDEQGQPCEPNSKELRGITDDKQRVKKLRNRLCHISWLLGYVKEKIARRANREDECTGHFWAKRFDMVRLETGNAVLAGSMYVDLNPIRAGIAETPESSLHTSAFRRIQSEQARRSGQVAKDAMVDRWLAPVSDRELPENQRFAERQWRASDDPGLDMTLEQYLELLDWTGRQLVKGKPGSIPQYLGGILERVGISSSGWLKLVGNFGALFKRIAGSKESVQQHAARKGRRWFQGISSCAELLSHSRSQK